MPEPSSTGISFLASALYEEVLRNVHYEKSLSSECHDADPEYTDDGDERDVIVIDFHFEDADQDESDYATTLDVVGILGLFDEITAVEWYPNGSNTDTNYFASIEITGFYQAFEVKLILNDSPSLLPQLFPEILLQEMSEFQEEDLN